MKFEPATTEPSRGLKGCTFVLRCPGPPLPIRPPRPPIAMPCGCWSPPGKSSKAVTPADASSPKTATRWKTCPIGRGSAPAAARRRPTPPTQPRIDARDGNPSFPWTNVVHAIPEKGESKPRFAHSDQAGFRSTFHAETLWAGRLTLASSRCEADGGQTPPRTFPPDWRPAPKPSTARRRKQYPPFP